MYIDEVTVFIIVKIPILKDLSKSMFDIVNKIVIKNNDRTNINIDKKYLFISEISVFEFIKDTLFEYIWFGLVWDNKLFNENLIKLINLITLIPELVEKKEPPMMTSIKNKKYKLFELLLNEIPIFDTLLVTDTKRFKKLLSLLKKIKIIDKTTNK